MSLKLWKIANWMRKKHIIDSMNLPFAELIKKSKFPDRHEIRSKCLRLPWQKVELDTVNIQLQQSEIYSCCTIPMSKLTWHWSEHQFADVITYGKTLKYVTKKLFKSITFSSSTDLNLNPSHSTKLFYLDNS